LLDIASATTAAERHAAIRRLPVRVIKSTPSDAKPGTLMSFVARGKTRIQLFVPAERAHAAEGAPEESDQPSVSGPFVSANTGRWKVGGDASCNWDPFDDGPHQCSPTQGRWKSDGQDGCYWDTNDSGPNQCEPPQNYCYSDGEWGACATDEEAEDALILAAELARSGARCIGCRLERL
jgi:hypothetical protein